SEYRVRSKLDSKMSMYAGKYIYVIWRDDYSSKVFFSKSVDNGATFTKPLIIDAGRSDSDLRATIFGNDIHVIWKDNRDGIAYTRSIDNGTSFSTPILLTNNSEAYKPDIAAFQNNIYVVWHDYLVTSNISMVSSLDKDKTPSILSNFS
ncbi:MAG: hypothetical protein WCA39_16245, partial [Nitrososphaeraceae archaeon]